MDYEINYVGDESIKGVHHIGVNYNGNYYPVIFGRYMLMVDSVAYLAFELVAYWVVFQMYSGLRNHWAKC